MPGWNPLSNWMAFPHLSDGAGLTRAYTLAYKITDDNAGDPWTGRFNGFKAKEMVALSGAVGVMQVAVPELITTLGLVVSQTAFVPAPSSGETQASANGFVATLARLSASASGANFELTAVNKQAHRPIHMCGGVAGRDAELAKAAYMGTKLVASTAVIFDDYITRGGTMSRMAQALIKENPGLRVIGVALGKTERREYWGALTNDHVPQRWADLWDQGEQRYREWQARNKP